MKSITIGLDGMEEKKSRSFDSLIGDLDINQLKDWSFDSFSRKGRENLEPELDSRVVLGMKAEEKLLNEPATPGTPKACKRLFSPEKLTPRGRPRKFSSTQMNSPALRRNLITIVPDAEFNIICQRAVASLF